MNSMTQKQYEALVARFDRAHNAWRYWNAQQHSRAYGSRAYEAAVRQEQRYWYASRDLGNRVSRAVVR